jgi:hypothetical protein
VPGLFVRQLLAAVNDPHNARMNVALLLAQWQGRSVYINSTTKWENRLAEVERMINAGQLDSTIKRVLCQRYNVSTRTLQRDLLTTKKRGQMSRE